MTARRSFLKGLLGGGVVAAVAGQSGTAQAYQGGVSIAQLPAGSTVIVTKGANGWPQRPTARADIVVQWKGPGASPDIVESGTGGMLDNVDVRLVTG